MPTRVEKINEHLQNMVGKTYTYAKALHHVLTVKVDEQSQEFSINTNMNTFIRKFDSFENFIQYWNRMDQANPAPSSITKSGSNNESQDIELSVFVEAENSLADSMISILRDNITKVQANAAYIDQAQVINNNINSVINVMKMKMQFLKEVKRKK
jgi:hypothetical protein